MIAKILFGGNYLNSRQVTLKEHPLLTLVDFSTEKVFVLNYTSHLGREVDVLRRNNGNPYTVQALRPSKRIKGQTEFLTMFLSRDCAVFDLDSVIFPKEEPEVVEKPLLKLGTYTCFNYKEVIEKSLKMLKEDTEKLYFYNPRDSKQIREFETVRSFKKILENFFNKK